MSRREDFMAALRMLMTVALIRTPEEKFPALRVAFTKGLDDLAVVPEEFFPRHPAQEALEMLRWMRGHRERPDWFAEYLESREHPRSTQ